jgi:hypothetical protein
MERCVREAGVAWWWWWCPGFVGGVDASLAAHTFLFENSKRAIQGDQSDTPGDYKQYASQATCLGCVVVEEVGRG